MIRLIDILNEAENRIARKPGQHKGSSKHSDLYTDENPKGTIHGLKFASVKDAEVSVNKIKKSGKSHAHKMQAAIAMEQRAKAAGKTTAAGVYRSYINSVKKIKEDSDPESGKAAPYGSGYAPVKEIITDTEVICDGPDCNHRWKIADGGKYPYLCHKCGNDNSVQPN